MVESGGDREELKWFFDVVREVQQEVGEWPRGVLAGRVCVEVEEVSDGKGAPRE